MITIISIILFLIFLFLGSIHFYWAFGGRWGITAVIPTKNDGAESMTPPIIATIIVGLGLLLFGVFYLNQSRFSFIELPLYLENICKWSIPILFILRAIGEFNYVGIFKKIKHTNFAKMDRLIFTPLCLAIGTLGLVVILLN